MDQLGRDFLSVERYRSKARKDRWTLRRLYLESLLDPKAEEEMEKNMENAHSMRWERRASEMLGTLKSLSENEQSAKYAQLAVTNHLAEHPDEGTPVVEDLISRYAKLGDETSSDTRQSTDDAPIRLDDTEEAWRPKDSYQYPLDGLLFVAEDNCGIQVLRTVHGEAEEISHILPLPSARDVRQTFNDNSWASPLEWIDPRDPGRGSHAQRLAEDIIDMAKDIKEASAKARETLRLTVSTVARVDELEVGHKGGPDMSKRLAGDTFSQKFRRLDDETISALQERARVVSLWENLERRASEPAESCWKRVNEGWSTYVRDFDQGIVNATTDDTLPDEDRETISDWAEMVKKVNDPKPWQDFSIRSIRESMAKRDKDDSVTPPGQSTNIGSQADRDLWDFGDAIDREVRAFAEGLSTRGIEQIPETLDELVDLLKRRRRAQDLQEASVPVTEPETRPVGKAIMILAEKEGRVKSGVQEATVVRNDGVTASEEVERTTEAAGSRVDFLVLETPADRGIVHTDQQESEVDLFADASSPDGLVDRLGTNNIAVMLPTSRSQTLKGDRDVGLLTTTKSETRPRPETPPVIMPPMYEQPTGLVAAQPNFGDRHADRDTENLAPSSSSTDEGRLKPAAFHEDSIVSRGRIMSLEVAKVRTSRMTLLIDRTPLHRRIMRRCLPLFRIPRRYSTPPILLRKAQRVMTALKRVGQLRVLELHLPNVTRNEVAATQTPPADHCRAKLRPACCIHDAIDLLVLHYILIHSGPHNPFNQHTIFTA